MKHTKPLFCFIFYFIFYSCRESEEINTQAFESFLYEPCMIVNHEQDNTIEGEYLVVDAVTLEDSSISITLPNDFYVQDANYQNWVVGWGTGIPLYDAGVENIREIKKMDLTNNTIYLGSSLRGEGMPLPEQRVVFWNKTPSGFSNEQKTPVIDPNMWPTFIGDCIHFGSIKFDPDIDKWVVIVNECKSPEAQIYAAVSDNLIDWKPANNGNPILSADDFILSDWCGFEKTGSVRKVPSISDIVYHSNAWYLFLFGYDKKGEGHIGIAISEQTSIGPYKVMDQPILPSGKHGEWNDKASFFPKVEPYKNGFIMFYDGVDIHDNERVGMATSDDLISWSNVPHNPVIDQHTGWRSSTKTTEPCYVEVKNDTIFLLLAGDKKFYMGPWHHYITKRMYLDKSGNVSDIQHGMYMSVDGGNTFIAHTNNPLFTNDYTNPFENEHLGGGFDLIKTDSIDYIFYKAKSSFNGPKYSILLRSKRKK